MSSAYPAGCRGISSNASWASGIFESDCRMYFLFVKIFSKQKKNTPRGGCREHEVLESYVLRWNKENSGGLSPSLFSSSFVFLQLRWRNMGRELYPARGFWDVHRFFLRLQLSRSACGWNVAQSSARELLHEKIKKSPRTIGNKNRLSNFIYFSFSISLWGKLDFPKKYIKCLSYSFAGIAQLARVPPCHGGCCGFESHYLLHIPISIKHLLGILILEIITITLQSSFQETNKSP